MMKNLSLYLTASFGLALLNLSAVSTPALAASGASPGSVAAVGVGAMSSGSVGGIGSAGAHAAAKMNRPGPSVIWYPPEYSAKKQRGAGQECRWLYRKAKTTGTRYWRSRYDDCIAMR